MKTIPYYIVDVFARNRYEGNQLGVFLDLSNELSDAHMQQIAREINFAESAFIKKDKGQGHFEVRIFTPEHEVPFAGHPSLGTGYIISKFLLSQPTSKLVLELAHGHIPLSIADPQHINNSLLYMYQTQPVFNDVYTREQISLALNIPPDDLARTLPIQEISTGLPYIIVPLNSIQAMENMRLSYESLTEMLKSVYKHKTNNPDGYSSSLFFFTKQSYEAGSTYNARMFLIENEKLSEDAATGSANGCLLAYLLTYDQPQVKAIVEQGFQMGRKSYIYLNGALTDGMYHIQVGGYCQLISQGTWYI